jgi:hypothetical protein
MTNFLVDVLRRPIGVVFDALRATNSFPAHTRRKKGLGQNEFERFLKISDSSVGSTVSEILR